MTNQHEPRIYGWYDRPDQPVDQPTYNPPFDSPCPYCSKPLTDDDMRTHSIMPLSNLGAANGRSYFYRTHKTCDEMAFDKSRYAVDSLVFEQIAIDARAEKAVGNG